MNPLTIKELLAELGARGVRLSLRDDQLHCEAPAGAVSRELREALITHKPAITALLRRERDVRLCPVERATTPAHAPLSHCQRRLWLQAQLEGENASYNIAIALRVAGDLNVSALENAIAEVVHRHESLRTSFEVVDGLPTQVIHEHVSVPLAKYDLRAHPETERTRALQRIMADESLHRFTLSVAPLLRAALVQTAPLEHVLLVTMPHLVSDGASLGIFVDEVSALYVASVRERAVQLRALPVQYADFADWQRRKLSEAELVSLRAYWVDELTGAPPATMLPTDRGRSNASGMDGGREVFTLSHALVADLRARSRESGTTLFMTLLAGFATLLARYSNQDEVVIGSPVSMRDHPDLEPVIGMFVNTLALRVRLDDDPSFTELLRRVRRTATDAYAHQDMPFDYVVEALRPERVAGQHPIFQVMFLAQNAPAAVQDVAGLRFEVLEHERFSAQFDLLLMITETPHGVEGMWQFRRDLFDAATIRRATGHLEAILTAIAVEPSRRMLSAPLLTKGERSQMLASWNATSKRYPTLCVHELVAAQARRTPDAVAVSCGETRLTYRELTVRVSQIAQQLTARGVVRGAYVAVLLPRTPDMLASILAALEVGAAYIPLDPALPSERLEYMLDDARPAVILTLDATARRLSHRSDAICALDRDEPRSSDHVATIAVGPEDPAYVLYTSGSTGRPKGTIILHRGLTNYLSWCTETYALDEATTSAVSTSIGFDATITSLFSPLLVGGTVVLLPEGDAELESLARLLQSERRHVLAKLTPAHIDALRALAPSPAQSGSPRTFVIGGEQLLKEHVEWCRTTAPEGRVFNEYGPTETVVGCCVHEVPIAAPMPEIIPIGRPIGNTQLYVLNETLEPVPVGVDGELYIGGAGLALGYLHRPELTDERFIPNPFSTEPRARLYRTGDRASYLADGTLRYLGRLDSQVKVRGYRVELGEIEAELTRTGDVRQAAVVLRTAGTRRARIVAYIVPSDSYGGETALRDKLARHLPDYMLPDDLVAMAALPISANGKVERRALPPPAAGEAEGLQAEAAPTELELALAKIWAELLDLPSVAVTDNFFRLGGDSIIGIQFVARARLSGVQLTPKQLMEHPTIRGLARVASVGPGVAAPSLAVTGAVMLTPIQRRFFALNQPDPHHFNQSIMLTLDDGCELAALQRALGSVVDHHDMLRARFLLGESGPEQIVGPALGRLDMAIEDLSHLPAEAQRAALEHTASRLQGELALADGRLFSPTLIRLGGGQPARLLLTAHHLIMDGVSWRIVVEDLVRAYRQAVAGAPIALAPKTTSFRDWSRRIAEHARSAELESERSYWAFVTSLASKSLALDFEPREDSNLEASSKVVTHTLTCEETERLRRTAPAEFGADIQELLLAALATAFTEPGDDTQLRIELEGHGREALFEDLDVSRTVGWFTSVFPFALPLRSDAGTRETLAAVRERIRAVPTHGIGYGLLRALRAGDEPGQSLSGPDRVQVTFNYFGQLDRSQPIDSTWELAPESCGPARSARAPRLPILEVNASIVAERLVVDWTYSERLHRRETVERLAEKFSSALRELLQSAPVAEPRRLSPADFPDVDLSEESLAHVLREVARSQLEY